VSEARANVAALKPQYRSKVEEAWADIGAIYIAAEFDARVVWQMYEPATLTLSFKPRATYMPDFLYILETGQVVFVEVKSRKGGRGYTATRSRIRIAADRFPFFTFVQATGSGKSFELEVIE